MPFKNFTLTKKDEKRGELVLHFKVDEQHDSVSVLKYPVGDYLIPYGYCNIGKCWIHRDQRITIKEARDVWKNAKNEGWKQ